MRVLANNLNKEEIKSRLLGDGKPFLEDPFLRPQIEENWRFIFQEPLFPGPEGDQGGEGPPRSHGLVGYPPSTRP